MPDVLADRLARDRAAAARRGRRADRRRHRLRRRRARDQAVPRPRRVGAEVLAARRASGSAILSGPDVAGGRARGPRSWAIDPVVQGADDKLPAFEAVLAEPGCGREQVCDVGDDLPDLPVLPRCGLAVAVADACPGGPGRGPLRHAGARRPRGRPRGGRVAPAGPGDLGLGRGPAGDARPRVEFTAPRDRTHGPAWRDEVSPSSLGTLSCGPPGALSWPSSGCSPSRPATSAYWRGPSAPSTGSRPCPTSTAGPRRAGPRLTPSRLTFRAWTGSSSWPSGRTVRNSATRSRRR